MVKAISRHYPEIGPKVLKKTAKASDRIVGVPADIQTRTF
jgi:hypothetical protein